MFSKFWRPRKPITSYFSQIMDVHAANKPGFIQGSLSGDSWRHDSMRKTLAMITDLTKHAQLQEHATNNLAQWAKEKEEAPKSVDVVYKDWGAATLAATRRYGVPYAVLNMASSLYPGGAVLAGGHAQEENMWHRSNCPLSLLDRGVYLDKETDSFKYHEATTALLEGRTPMSEKELELLRAFRGETIHQANKVYYAPDPRMCFRGPEILVEPDSDEMGPRSQLVPDSFLSYPLLPSSDIFPFYELRSAAPERVMQQDDWEQDSQDDLDELRRRIAAQLDTLIIAGRTHVILGAWGCGSFNNNPEIVARIYREEIEKRAQCFDHILFPIIRTDNHKLDNFDTFNRYLDGMQLSSNRVMESRM